jgi:hypothetical protein
MDKLFHRANAKADSESVQNPTAIKVRQLVPKCLVCNSDSKGHQFAQIATTVINDENRPRVLALYDHVKKHEWNSLSGFRDFRGDVDTAIVYAIRGPHPGGTVVLTRDPTEMWAAPEVYLEEPATGDELETISQIVPESEWKEL